LERFFRKGSKPGIQPSHAAKLKLQLLDGVTEALDMNLPGWAWHPLKDGRPLVRVGEWELAHDLHV
jgi:plasmid maintenance system killer protein